MHYILILQDGDAPLHIAVRGNLVSIIKILVKHGADLSVQDKVSMLLINQQLKSPRATINYIMFARSP